MPIFKHLWDMYTFAAHAQLRMHTLEKPELMNCWCWGSCGGRCGDDVGSVGAAGGSCPEWLLKPYDGEFFVADVVAEWGMGASDDRGIEADDDC